MNVSESAKLILQHIYVFEFLIIQQTTKMFYIIFINYLVAIDKIKIICYNLKTRFTLITKFKIQEWHKLN